MLNFPENYRKHEMWCFAALPDVTAAGETCSTFCPVPALTWMQKPVWQMRLWSYRKQTKEKLIQSFDLYGPDADSCPPPLRCFSESILSVQLLVLVVQMLDCSGLYSSSWFPLDFKAIWLEFLSQVPAGSEELMIVLEQTETSHIFTFGGQF